MIKWPQFQNCHLDGSEKKRKTGANSKNERYINFCLLYIVKAFYQKIYWNLLLYPIQEDKNIFSKGGAWQLRMNDCSKEKNLAQAGHGQEEVRRGMSCSQANFVQLGIFVASSHIYDGLNENKAKLSSVKLSWSWSLAELGNKKSQIFYFFWLEILANVEIEPIYC